MSKIYAFGTNPKTWFNFSNHLNILSSEITAYQNFLNYFKPMYNILNESMYVCDAATLTDSVTTPTVTQPEWKYIITSTDAEGVETIRSAYCYFPSELKYNEGYLNTHSNSYLLYQAPPGDVNSANKEFHITQEEWNNLIQQQEGQNFPVAQEFPMSCVVIAKQWQKSGVQSSNNPCAYDPTHYLLVSKPSASWYVPTCGLNSISFRFADHAMENVGTKVSLILEFFPSRYSFFSTDSSQNASGDKLKHTWCDWPSGSILYEQHSARWDDVNDNVPGHVYISNAKRLPWSGAFPIRHKLEYWKQTTSDTLSWDCESFITDDLFSSGSGTSKGHSVNYYTISISEDVTPVPDITDMWEDHVKIIMC